MWGQSCSKIHFFKVFGPNMTLVMFIWNMDSFKIIFVKDTFKHEKCLFERHFLIKFWSEVVFRKDDLRNIKILVRKCLSERRFSRLKVFFTKTILNKSIFQINITRVMFDPKTKKKMYFWASLAQIIAGILVINFWNCFQVYKFRELLQLFFEILIFICLFSKYQTLLMLNLLFACSNFVNYSV